jgi:hypothetical protein
LASIFQISTPIFAVTEITWICRPAPKFRISTEETDALDGEVVVRLLQTVAVSLKMGVNRVREQVWLTHRR